jgi:hypothetical protein
MRFGLASREITPPFPTNMGGYGARHDVFDDVNDPLTFTAVVLEEGGRRALLGAADLCNFPNDGTTPALLDRLAEVVQCPRDHIMLNASHTHGGPQVPSLSLYYRKTRSHPSCKRYADWLCEQVLAAVREAAGNLREGTLWYGQGKTATPMNRRLERNGRVDNAPNPQGPVDDRMQLLVFRNAKSETVAVGMRMSCHPVATGAQHRLTADYPGAWRAEFSRAFGSRVTPFFLQGAGADARPRLVADGDRWRALKHAELPTIGRELLSETLAILTSGNLKQVAPLVLEGNVVPVKAPCEKRYTQREKIEAEFKGKGGYEGMYAEECLRLLAAGQAIPDHVEYHVQTLWLSPELALIGLDVEPLVGLGRRAESAIAPKQAILLGYANGCISYLPDTAELKRGGYETMSYLYQPWSGPLLPGVEEIIAKAVVRRA